MKVSSVSIVKKKYAKLRKHVEIIVHIVLYLYMLIDQFLAIGVAIAMGKCILLHMKSRTDEWKYYLLVKHAKKNIGIKELKMTVL